MAVELLLELDVNVISRVIHKNTSSRVQLFIGSLSLGGEEPTFHQADEVIG
jgi:hypothetical protein